MADDKKTTADRARDRLFGGGSTPRRANRPTPPPEARAREEAPPPKKRRRKASSAKKPAPNTGNALGGGLYLYKGTPHEKMSVYVPTGTKARLKAAGFSPDDERGGDMSEIVTALLRENGYIK